MNRRAIGAAVVLATVAGVLGGWAGLSANAADDMPAIPRCLSDDYNDGTQDQCYTVRVTDGAVLVIDRSDRVISVGGE